MTIWRIQLGRADMRDDITLAMIEYIITDLPPRRRQGLPRAASVPL